MQRDRPLNAGDIVEVSATAYCLEGETTAGTQTRRGIVAADSRILPLGTIIRDRHLHAELRGGEGLRSSRGTGPSHSRWKTDALMDGTPVLVGTRVPLATCCDAWDAIPRAVPRRPDSS